MNEIIQKIENEFNIQQVLNQKVGLPLRFIKDLNISLEEFQNLFDLNILKIDYRDDLSDEISKGWYIIIPFRQKTYLDNYTLNSKNLVSYLFKKIIEK